MSKSLFLSIVFFSLFSYGVEFQVESKTLGTKPTHFSYEIQSDRRFVLYMKKEINTVIEQHVLSKRSTESIKKHFEDQFNGVFLKNLKIHR